MRRINDRGSHYNFIVFTFVSVLFLTLVLHANAASLFFSSTASTANIGDTVDVLVKIDSEGAGINAAQATVQYPKDILEVVKIEKGDTIFNFWLEEPSFSNENGKVTFVGGSSTGVSGKTLQVLKIIFKIKGGGKAELAFADGAVSASDGSGTNVLATVHSFVINSAPKTGTQETLTPSEPLPLTRPVQITRPAVPALALPIKPNVSMSLYPDPEKWYNGSANFLAQWTLPPDVSAVSTMLDQNIGYSGNVSEGLFDSKVFPAISKDGIWYLHVRFKNNIGWGPTTNYRIAIDTHPPLAFTASIVEGNPTDIPAPTLHFITKDGLSDIKEYQIKIGGGEIIRVSSKNFSGSYQLPLLPPGKDDVTIRAIDEADNSIETNVVLEITPIASPTITFVPNVLFSNDSGSGLNVKGTSLSQNKILIKVFQQAGGIAASGETTANANGNWEFTFDQPLKNDTYTVKARAQDSRGALSLVVESLPITVKSKPIIQLGSLQLGATGAFLLLLMIIAGGFASGFMYYKKQQAKISLRVTVASNEAVKIFTLIREDVEKLKQARLTSTESDDEFITKKLEENISRMEGYLKKGIEKIKS